ncbi:hypothetical protein KCG43_20330 [Photobacterium sp. WH24]|uniref:hypothetical protein n=1 Tax=Photobacterium sp. WH24 TaxID=2827237 RepID=UPI001C44C44B|nr:hypothetical protein [Photobacterium sp. WH24]MBV7264362.1 hypothetical protein [Photobacterium sp. WH24]
MKTQALYKETVGQLLHRVCGSDSDVLMAEFFRLNPRQQSLFLTPGQWVNIPDVVSEPDAASAAVEVIDLWE